MEYFKRNDDKVFLISKKRAFFIFDSLIKIPGTTEDNNTIIVSSQRIN